MSDSDILIRVDGVSKKFCRSLKQSLWYGVCDVAREVFPVARRGNAETLKTEKLKSVPKANTENGNAEKLKSITASQPVSVSALEDVSARPDVSVSEFQLSAFSSRNHTRDEDLRKHEFYAVRDVSFELRRGECLGLIGRNGAGKTTLLKMLNGLIKPDHGRITMRGRVGALIALGAGFNPILTGRENIYVNASVLGLTKREINEKIEEIIDFAEIAEFIDSPVQSYSSGMQVRLGFAVATALNPDILLLDEVLAVGDAAFRNKCYGRIVSLRKRAAVIFVSHGMEQIARICDHALVLSKGQVVHCGSVAKGVATYEQVNDEPSTQDKLFLSIQPPILSFTVSGLPKETVSGKPFHMVFHIEASAQIRRFLLRMTVYSVSGAVAADCNFPSADCKIAIEPGSNTWIVEIASLPLKNGKYRISFNIIDQCGDILVWSYKRHEVAVIGAYAGAVADCQLPLGKWACVPSSACTNENTIHPEA